jgi:hypothetical protein
MPALVQGSTSDDTSETAAACSIIVQLENDVAEAKDALLGAKIMQAFFANKAHNPEEVYHIGGCVMLVPCTTVTSSRLEISPELQKDFPNGMDHLP